MLFYPVPRHVLGCFLSPRVTWCTPSSFAVVGTCLACKERAIRRVISTVRHEGQNACKCSDWAVNHPTQVIKSSRTGSDVRNPTKLWMSATSDSDTLDPSQTPPEACTYSQSCLPPLPLETTDVSPLRTLPGPFWTPTSYSPGPGRRPCALCPDRRRSWRTLCPASFRTNVIVHFLTFLLFSLK